MPMMKQLHCPAAGMLEVVETPLPVIGAGEVLVQMRYCGVCGTDLMKVYAPDVAKPVQLGHEVVGVVAAVGAGVERVVAGQRVAFAHHVPDYSSHFTRRGSAPMDALFKHTNIDPGGFAEYIRVPALHVQHVLLPVPDDLPDLRAVFMEPLACCLRALDRVAVIEGDAALIVGVGAVGLLFAPLLADRAGDNLCQRRARGAAGVGAAMGRGAGLSSQRPGCDCGDARRHGRARRRSGCGDGAHTSDAGTCPRRRARRRRDSALWRQAGDEAAAELVGCLAP
jgi:hypothetical protein